MKKKNNRCAQINIRITEEEKMRWVKYAAEHKLTLTELIEGAVNQRINRSAAK